MNVQNDLKVMQQAIEPDVQQVQRTAGAQPVATVSHAVANQAPAKPAAAATPRDSASLSSAATLASQAASVSDVRMEKVTAVQQALANGTYSVSAGDVADKLISHMQQK